MSRLLLNSTLIVVRASDVMNMMCCYWNTRERADSGASRADHRTMVKVTLVFSPNKARPATGLTDQVSLYTLEKETRHLCDHYLIIPRGSCMCSM